MVQIEHLEFIRISKGFVNKPFEVTNAWVEYQKVRGSNVLFFVDSKEQPQILSWAKIKKVKFIGEVLEIQGPIYKETVSTKQLFKFLNALKDLPFKGVFLNLSTVYNVEFEVACRKAQFKRPIGQSSTNLTIVVDTSEFSPDRNWRRNVKSANEENFKFEVKQDASINDCEVIEKLHVENSKIKKLSYTLVSSQIKSLTEQDNIYVCFLYKNETPIAARIISIEESISYDVFASNSLESRNNGATQFFMQSIFDYLKSIEIYKFDFSRIPLGRKGAKGVYEFKNATRGQVIQYNGEWVFFKNKKLRHLYYLYNAIINKKDFY
ncbi:hypothetical protein [Winogradskyella sp.]|uniref:hypothetical protein n=1 Tax=Winogradskyella sp. TaxID=1883156 RepID=UPI0025D08B27|nr:hypothetical protein [Winogradskyella sp.]